MTCLIASFALRHNLVFKDFTYVQGNNFSCFSTKLDVKRSKCLPYISKL